MGIFFFSSDVFYLLRTIFLMEKQNDKATSLTVKSRVVSHAHIGRKVEVV